MSLSLIAVFIPILLMPGTVGLVFHEFAVTLSIAILISMVISLTITPCMCAWMLKDRTGATARARWAVWAERPVRPLPECLCPRACMAVLDHTLLVGLLLIGLIVGNVFLFRMLPSTFFPEQDTRHRIGQIIADQAISFPACPRARPVAGIVQKGPRGRLRSSARRLRLGRPRGQHRHRLHRPEAARRAGCFGEQIVQRLRPRLNGISGRAAVPALRSRICISAAGNGGRNTSIR